MKPCPFCGCKDIKLSDARCICVECKASGPTDSAGDMAEKLWNRRQPSVATQVMIGWATFHLEKAVRSVTYKILTEFMNEWKAD